MKYPFFIFSVLLSLSATAQPLIHAHNDYNKPLPLFNALNQQAWTIEADVHLYKDTLRVAHDTADLPHAPALETQYLQPLAARTGQVKNLRLMIDVKGNAPGVLARLVELLRKYPATFINGPVQVVISGERGPARTWSQWPPFIFFDGRPYETYDSSSLARIAFISNSYAYYLGKPQPADSLVKQDAARVHALGKKFRTWAIPDNPGSWQHLLSLGVDIINTDKVTECREWVDKRNSN